MTFVRTAFISLAVFLLAAASGSASGKTLANVEGAYGYPFADPFVATVLGTPQHMQAPLPTDLPVREHSLRFPSQHVPTAFWYNEQLFFTTAMQDEPAPLVFVVAGTGAGPDGGKMRRLMSVLYAAGFHVANLPSPTHSNFLVAASDTQAAGYLPLDAADLLRVMQRIRDEALDQSLITGYRLAGYSLGAAHALIIAHMDAADPRFYFERVMAINPPVDLYASAAILDSYLGGLENAQQTIRRLVASFARFYEKEEAVTLTDDFLYRLYLQEDIPAKDLRTAVGVSFRLTSASMVFSADVCLNAGYILPQGTLLGIAENYEPYFNAAVQVGFVDYFNEFLLPFLLFRGSVADREEALAGLSLNRLETWLASAKHVAVATNADELILTRGDLQYISNTFGDRARIYPTGGHCGNMAYPDNERFYVDWLRGEDAP